MKKLLALILAVSVLAIGLVACDTKKEEETTDKTFTLQEMSITLPAEFGATTASTPSSKYMKLAAPDYELTVNRIDHSSITPKEGAEFPAMDEFFTTSGLLADNVKKEDIELVDGLHVADCDTLGSSEPDVCSILMETEGAYWIIDVRSHTQAYDTVRENTIAWAKTVTFNTAE